MNVWNVVLVAMFLLLGGGAFSIGPLPAAELGPESTTPVVTGSITVEATNDYGYQPDSFQQIPTNATITVTFTDADTLAHSFTISSREGFVIPTSTKNAQLVQLFTEYPRSFRPS